MGQDFVQGSTHNCVPCLHQQFIRQGILDSAASTVQRLALGQEADLGRLCWLPQYWQVEHHQHTQEEEGVHSGTHRRRDQGVAVYHPDETDLSHRLSGYCTHWDGRQ